MDTIFALASGLGRAGVSVVRVSGPDAKHVGVAMCGELGKPFCMALRKIRKTDGIVIDEGLVVWFPEGRSFTGDETVELHVHGSIAVVQALLRELGGFGALRLAEAGEFTRRALENGKLDLAQVESLGDLIDAETEAQRLQALRGLAGALGKKVDQWREQLIHAASLIEVTIDFADEEVPVDVTPDVAKILDELIGSLEQELSGFEAAERVRSGFEVAIVGQPNVGKSTLVNRLSGRDAAIISDVPGTTRDVVEVRMDVGGLAVTFLDTAGLRETDDIVESIGVDRARSRASQADLRLFLLEEEHDLPDLWEEGDVVRRAKVDIATNHGNGVSGLTGQGLEALLTEIAEKLANRVAGAGLITHERHRVALGRGLEALFVARDLLAHGPSGYDLVAEEIRTAVRSLDRLVGRIDVEDLLDRIFSSFCIGK